MMPTGEKGLSLVAFSKGVLAFRVEERRKAELVKYSVGIIVVMLPSRFIFFSRTRREIFVNTHTARARPLNVHSGPYEVHLENGLPSTLSTTSGGYLV